MDAIPPLDDAEIERRLMAKAVDEALRNITPGRPHSVVRLEMLQKIAELDEKIARMLAE